MFADFFRHVLSASLRVFPLHKRHKEETQVLLCAFASLREPVLNYSSAIGLPATTAYLCGAQQLIRRNHKQSVMRAAPRSIAPLANYR
jgi:hypothetical protein